MLRFHWVSAIHSQIYWVAVSNKIITSLNYIKYYRHFYRFSLEFRIMLLFLPGKYLGNVCLDQVGILQVSWLRSCGIKYQGFISQSSPNSSIWSCSYWWSKEVRLVLYRYRTLVPSPTVVDLVTAAGLGRRCRPLSWVSCVLECVAWFLCDSVSYSLVSIRVRVAATQFQSLCDLQVCKIIGKCWNRAIKM